MALNLDAIGKKIGPVIKTYDWRDVVLYALGVGAGFDELEYCYENRLKVIPSFSIGAVFDFLAQVGVSSGADLTGILHGEQDIIFYNPIPPEGQLITEGAITHFYDKGKDTGALVVAEADTFHSNGQKLFTNIFTLFCRRDGGFGGPDAPKEPVEFPDRPPDFEEEDTPSPNQPLIYRLSGDIFALHVDPDFAKASGFEKPIMHGLCTHGFACRAVIKHLFPGEPERMRRFRNRFSKTLYPGTPIKTQIWKLRDGYALFRTINALTGEITIDRGIVEWETGSIAHIRTRREELRFDDQVAVITGAGRGLGRVYALELAKRGAKVVVNDFGGPRNGAGEGAPSAADSVVEEIKALGGEAIANYDSVSTEEGGRRIIDAAMDAFGRLDILINNAGILRDKSFLKLEPADWEAVRAVHLDGAYFVTRPAFNHMRDNKYGRIVFTTSAAGLYGNFGQTNYSAAKMGLVGLMNSLKLEGDKYGIKVNAIAPIATTRLTEDILPPDLAQRMKPELIAPLALVLCSDRCPSNGSIYGAGMGRYFRIALVTGRSISLNDGSGVLTPETIAANFANIVDIKSPVEYGSATEALGEMLQALQERAEGSESRTQGLTVQQVFEKDAPVVPKGQSRWRQRRLSIRYHRPGRRQVVCPDSRRRMSCPAGQP